MGNVALEREAGFGEIDLLLDVPAALLDELLAGERTLRIRKAGEKIVERPVLLDHQHDVLDLWPRARRRLGWTVRGGNRGRTAASAAGQRVTREEREHQTMCETHRRYSVSTGKFDGFSRKKYALEYFDGICWNARGDWPKLNISAMLVQVESVVPSRPKPKLSSTNRRMLPNS